MTIPFSKTYAPLEEPFIKQWGITDYYMIKKFKSKKNHVYLVSSHLEAGLTERFVLKQYADPAKGMEKEIRILKELHRKEIPAPVPYYSGKNHVIMEYVKGQLLLNVFEKLEISGLPEKEAWHKACNAVVSLARWFKRFYETVENLFGQTMILYDVNLRNFILRDMVYGFDFEDCRPGKKETDTGRLCAYILTYDPAFTDWKKLLAREFFMIFTRNLGLNRPMVREEMLKELQAISQRRKLVYPAEIQNMMPILREMV